MYNSWMIIILGQFAASIALEIKRMARRKQLHYPQRGNSPPLSKSPPPMSTTPPPQSSSSSHTSSDCRSLSQTYAPTNSTAKRDVPLFTLKQVSLFCERLVKEREEHVREEYNKILTTKLAGKHSIFIQMIYTYTNFLVFLKLLDLTSMIEVLLWLLDYLK